MRTVSTILLTVTLMVSVPAIAAPTGLHCLTTEDQEPVFLVIDVQRSSVAMLSNDRVDYWQSPFFVTTTVDTVSFRLDRSLSGDWVLNRKTLVLARSFSGGIMLGYWQCNTMTERSVRMRAAQYQQERQEGNRI